MDAAEFPERLGSTEDGESAPLSADAHAFLLENQKGLRMHRIMLTFQSSGEAWKWDLLGFSCVKEE